MYARDITIYCPFLIVNKTHLALRVIDTAPPAETPSIAPPLPDSNIAQPLLFRCFQNCSLTTALILAIQAAALTHGDNVHALQELQGMSIGARTLCQ